MGKPEPGFLLDDLKDIVLRPEVTTRDHLLLRPVAAHFVKLFGLHALDAQGLGRWAEAKPENTQPDICGHEL